MTNLELQKHLLRLWLDEKPLPELEYRVPGASGWKVCFPETHPFDVPMLSSSDYRIKPKEYKVDQPVWVKCSSNGVWYARHYAGLIQGKHSVWTSGTTSHSAGHLQNYFDVFEITDVDPNV
jgi:hypothetical protein